MSTSQSEIRSWLLEAKKNKSTHLIVVCDTFDWEDYPVEVKESENVREVYKRYDGKDMQRVMEVYNLALNIEEQLNTPRVFNF